MRHKECKFTFKTNVKEGEENVQILILDELDNEVPFVVSVNPTHINSYPYFKEITFLSRTRRLKVHYFFYFSILSIFSFITLD